MRIRVRLVVPVALGIAALAAGAVVAGMGETARHFGSIVPGVLLAVAGIAVVAFTVDREARSASRRAQRAERVDERLERFLGDDQAG